jgi:tetratricopeptide (TPR) repeat protein
MRKAQIFFFVFVLGGLQLMAQDCDWQAAQKLLTKHNYSLAQSYFSSMSSCTDLTEEQKEEAVFQSAVCAMELFNTDAVYQLEKYLAQYPTGLFVNKAIFRLGNIHFREKNYATSIAKYNQVNLVLLKKEERIMLHFRLGYSSFVESDFDASKMAFGELGGVQFKFKDLTKYYVSHIAYVEGHYATAYKGFHELLEVPGIGSIVRYYIAQIYYFQGRYDDLVGFAQPLLDSANTKRSPEIARLIGDSYYRTNHFDRSIAYLERHQSSTILPLNRLDKYQLAYAYYRVQNFEKAKSLFQEVLQESDSLAQYAAYHLADCYLKNNQKGYSLNAYKHASSFSFDASLQEDAAFNHAKLVYEDEASYADAAVVFRGFMEQFPNSNHLPLIQDYLVQAYSSSNDYKSALASLEQLGTLSFEQKQSYQRMAYFRAVELFNNESEELALKYFEKSLKYPIHGEYKALCYYWKGEAYDALGRFADAIQQYEKFLYASGSFRLPEYANVYYALGYANYHQQAYSKSIKWFRKYINNATDNQKLNDACLRAGDAYFMTNQYGRAADYYTQAESVAAFDVDYAIYQQAQCFGLSDEEGKKQAALEQLIAEHASSPYVDDAKFALANIHLANNLRAEGLELLKDVVANHPFSPLVKSSLLKLGLSYYNADQTAEATANFKQVIEDYPSTNESAEALVGLKNVYVEAGDVKSYFDYVQGLSNVSVSAAAQDSITYEAAEMLYAKGEQERAVSAFGEYLQNFPAALFKLSAHFYKAELLSVLGKQEALQDYLAVLEFAHNQFTEQSLSQAARLELDKHEFAIAALHYNQLLEQAQDKELQREATISLFTCYKALNNTEEMKNSAERILGLDKLSDDLEVEARLVLGNAAFYSSEYHLAAQHYKWIVEATSADAGAEAKYQLTYILFLQDDLTTTEESVFQLAEHFTNDYFIAKGFILLGDVYIDQGNLFQAKATLESVIENHDGEELNALAKEKLQVILSLEESQNQNGKEEEIIIDLLNDMDIDYESFMEEEEENTVEDEE